MKTALMASLLLALLAWPVHSAPQADPSPKEGDFIAHDFHFQNGQVLPELRLHYTTLGTPRRDEKGRVTNAVLLLHGTTGTGKNFLAPSYAKELFGAGQALDAARYYIILPDGIGRGGSSKPSDGLRARFPRYGYTDVVAAQQLLVTQGLSVEHLRLVLGTSMGGMQTWMWGERYPDMMDALMPIASQPTQISGRNLLWRRIITEAIRNDPDWKGGEYTAPPTHWVSAVPLFTLMVDSAVRLQAQAPTRPAGNALYDRLVAAALKGLDANDYLYWFESSWDYDPEPELGRIKARLVAVNFADDLINASELGVMEKVKAKLPQGRFALVPASDRTIGHQTLTQAVVWKPYLEELLRSLP
jgi:homoserine O-acetyltransferase